MIVNEVKKLPSRRRRNKYNVAPKSERTVDGIVFASKAEAECYRQLWILQQSGAIQWVIRQPSFDLPGGITYRADFLVRWSTDLANGYLSDHGPVTILDVKGALTRVYAIKRKLADAEGIPIVEIPAKVAGDSRQWRIAQWQRDAESRLSSASLSAPTGISRGTPRARCVSARWHESSRNSSDVSATHEETR